MTLQIDMRTKKVMSTDTASRRREQLYDIQSAAADPVKAQESGASFQQAGRQAGPLTTRERQPDGAAAAGTKKRRRSAGPTCLPVRPAPFLAAWRTARPVTPSPAVPASAPPIRSPRHRAPPIARTATKMLKQCLRASGRHQGQHQCPCRRLP
ncbi:hypothetical protein LP420_39540 [Massilia sp. B-10]|nr:hypothetical protein LP420_39540 [Massilia sp. B-10]